MVGNISKICDASTVLVASMHKSDDFARVEVVMMLELLPGESRGYLRHHSLGKWSRQAKALRTINTARADMLFDNVV